MPSTRSVTCSQSVTYGGNGGLITVWYHPSLDGGGSIMAPHFVRLLTDAKRPLGRVLELCAGPGFIAFALLASGRATSVVISDANPAAIECARKTVRTNRIGARARALVANVTRGLPRAARFETVVVNPPNFYAMRGWVSEIVGSATGDLRGEDRGWALHRELYAQLPPFMAPHARLYVQARARACMRRASRGPSREPISSGLRGAQEVQPWSTHVHACAFRPDGRHGRSRATLPALRSRASQGLSPAPSVNAAAQVDRQRDRALRRAARAADQRVQAHDQRGGAAITRHAPVRPIRRATTRRERDRERRRCAVRPCHDVLAARGG